METQNQTDFNTIKRIEQCKELWGGDDTPKITFDREGYINWSNAVGLSDVPNLNGCPNEAKIRPFGEWIKANTKVSAMTVYKQDVKVKRVCIREVPPGNNGAVRGEATEITQKSLDNLRFLALNTDVDMGSIMTLTYPNDFPTDGEAVKKHLNSLLTRLRSRYGEELAYIWVIEFQKRDAPHYHVVLNLDLAKLDGTMVKKRRRTGRYTTNIDHENWLAMTWNRIIFNNKYWQPDEADKEKGLNAGVAWETIRDKNGGAKYIAKYATKPYQKQIPEAYQNIGRAWGASRNVRKAVKERAVIKLDGVPLVDDTIMDLMEYAGADYVESCRKLGYLPKVLFGVGKLLLKPNKAVDDFLIYFDECSRGYIKPNYKATPKNRLDQAIDEYKHLKMIEEIAEKERADKNLQGVRAFYGSYGKAEADRIWDMINEGLEVFEAVAISTALGGNYGETKP